jgi:putative ABC transport system substrate-binding protein
MRRRELITLLGGAAAWPVAARAQQADRMRRVGILTGFPQGDLVGESLIEAFRQQLMALGWSEGRNISFETRWGDANPEHQRAYGAELARMMPDVIVVHGSQALTAVRKATDRIPILFASVSDPVASGYVASLARPGGNVTGFTNYTGTPSPKLLEMLKYAAPSVTRVAFMITPSNPGMSRQLQTMESAAASFAITTTAMLIRDPTAIARTIADFAQDPNGGLVVTSDVFMITHRDLIVPAAARYRLPATYQDRSFVEAGGLMSYSVDRRESYRRVATYVDRILRGAQPADLPVQQPTKFEFVLNMKTAKALGITVPRFLRVLADEVIE